MNTTRIRWAIFAVLPIVLASLGCNSTQPDQASAQTASFMVSSEAKVDNNDCWEIWYDTDGNGLPDYNSGQVYCEPVTDETKVTRPVPWRYTLVISVLRSGETTQELIASSVVPGDGIPDFVSMTPYDTTVQAAANKAPADGNYYVNGKRVSSGSQYYLNAIGYDLGPANVLEQTPSYDFKVNPGDTIIVQARKQPYADAPPYLNFDQDPELTIAGVLTLGGIQVQVNGDEQSGSSDKAGFSFSYTRK